MKHVSKVIVIGLDGATWDLIEPWIEEGKLKYLRRLYQNSISGVLESVIPSSTVPAWPSICSGKNPGKTGVIDFVKSSGTLVNSKDIKSLRLWDYLSINKIKSCILNIPVTYPPSKIIGCLVSCFLAPPGSIFTYPPELTEELNKLGYKIDLEFGERYAIFPDNAEVFENRFRLLPHIFEILEKRIESFFYIIDKFYPDFVMINFKMIDVLQHLFWDKPEIILKGLQIVDKKVIGSIINSNSIIILLSDHGFYGSPRQEFNMKEWLIQKGYIKITPYIHIKRLLLKLLARYELWNNKNLIKLFKVFKQKLQLRQSDASGTNQQEKIKFKYFGLFVGSEDIKRKIIRELKMLDQVFIDVFDGKKLYPGPYSDNVPDVIWLPKPDYRIIFSDIPKMFFDKKPDLPGSHEFALSGIFLAYGQGIKKGYKIENAKIYDIAPTILHIFGLPIPNDMDGRVLMEIFEEDSEFARRKPKYVDPSYYGKKGEDEKLKKAIKNLKLKGKI